MRATVEPRTDASALSCYTANLVGYLSREYDDPAAHVARSVRLAVRTDTPDPCFSHHRYPLNWLPDETFLRYAAAPAAAEALRGLDSELARHGQVLVVAHTGNLPWSPSYGGAGAPHWLLISDRTPDGWQVADRFAALLPGGEHRPYAGWLADAELVAAIAPRPQLTAEQRSRNRYAFGFPLPLPPDTSVQWLVREPRRGTPAARASLGEPAGLAGPGEPAVLPGQWASGAAALEHLATLIISQGETASRHLDDIWAAAQHQCFRLAWLTRKYPDAAEALGAEHEAWRRLPMALRFAVDSARRGRPRPALIDQSFSDLALTLNRPSIDIKEALQR